MALVFYLFVSQIALLSKYSACFTRSVGIDVLHLFPIALFMHKHLHYVASLELNPCECLSHEIVYQFY